MLKKSDASALLEAYNRRIGRAGQSGAGAATAGGTAAAGARGGAAGLLPRIDTGGVAAGAPFGGSPASAAAAARVQASTQVTLLTL